MTAYTDFHYTPTGTGVISGKEVLEQTEDGINDLGQYVQNNVSGAIDTANQALTIAQTANANATTALNTANSLSAAITTANQTANNALTTAQSAQNTANSASSLANTANNNANTALNAANTATSNVATLTSSVNALGNRMTTSENNISANAGNITTLQNNLATTNGNVTAAQNAASAAQATATSAQNTATMARQQAYVLRYSSTAITDNSTIAYSTIDNTDNIKSGDKILDVDGKLFEITAVDTTNQTVTVGSALIDLALDANVMHLSGDETALGNKTFTDNIIAKKIVSNVAQLQINARSDADSAAVIAGASASDGGGVWVYGKNTSNNSMVTLQVYDTANSTYHAVRLYMDGSFCPTVSNNGLGNSSYKWVSFNGLTPSSLSLPSDRSARVDISGYFTNTASGDTNTYTAVANGWIYLSLNDVTEVNLESQTSGGLTNYGDYRSRSSNGTLSCLFPIRSGDVFVSQWYTTTTVTVTNAYFIPCLGNI